MMASNESFKWKPKLVCYELELEKKKKKKKVVTKDDFHPLKLITVFERSVIKTSNINNKNVKIKEKKTEFIDPLSTNTLSGDPLSGDPLSGDPLSGDPLSLLANENTSQKIINEKTDHEDSDKVVVDEWGSYKMKILNKFTTDEKLSISMTTLAKGDSLKKGQNRDYNTSVSDKMKTRLGQLDDFEEGGFHEMQNLTQQEFINKINELKQTLKDAWQFSQKVKALKIAIQCAKLLNDVSVIQFYPSKFVLIADVLDSFGTLVFERILSKCTQMPSKDKIDPKSVTTAAREICVNWLMKIASIRELLPRLCVEAATIRCVEFIKPGECNVVLLRLTNMVRGIGNPLVAVFVRAYLCRVGMQHLPEFRGYLKYNFYDYLSSFQQIQRESLRNILASQKLSLDTYLSHHVPAVHWILSCLSKNAHEETLTEVLDKCKTSDHSLLLINCCLVTFSSGYIAARSFSICRQICSFEDTVVNKLLALEALGNCVIKGEPPQQDRLPLLNEVWKLLVKVKNPQQFVSCAVPWTEYAAKYFTVSFNINSSFLIFWL